MSDENNLTQSDWRIKGKENFLRGAKLFWRQYERYSEEWDHDHCSFCWAKFMVEDFPDVLHEGFCTEDQYDWVCKQCFDDFKDQLGWEVVNDK